MELRTLQKVTATSGAQEHDFFVDIEFHRTESHFKCVEITGVRIHHAYVMDERRSAIIPITEENRKRYNLPDGMMEMVRGGLVEVELDDPLRSHLETLFIEGVVHTKMCEAIHSFQNLEGNHSREWRLPDSRLL